MSQSPCWLISTFIAIFQIGAFLSTAVSSSLLCQRHWIWSSGTAAWAILALMQSSSSSTKTWWMAWTSLQTHHSLPYVKPESMGNSTETHSQPILVLECRHIVTVDLTTSFLRNSPSASNQCDTSLWITVQFILLACQCHHHPIVIWLTWYHRQKPPKAKPRVECGQQYACLLQICSWTQGIVTGLVYPLPTSRVLHKFCPNGCISCDNPAPPQSCSAF